MSRRLAWLLLVAVVLVVSCSADPEFDQGAAPTATPTATAPTAAAPTATDVVPDEPSADSAPVAVAPPSTPTPVPTPSPIPTLVPSPTPVPPQPTVPVVSDEVPSVQELLDIGLTPTQAECFISTIDPDGTGRIQHADLFLEALGSCT